MVTNIVAGNIGENKRMAPDNKSEEVVEPAKKQVKKSAENFEFQPIDLGELSFCNPWDEYVLNFYASSFEAIDTLVSIDSQKLNNKLMMGISQSDSFGQAKEHNYCEFKRNKDGKVIFKRDLECISDVSVQKIIEEGRRFIIETVFLDLLKRFGDKADELEERLNELSGSVFDKSESDYSNLEVFYSLWIFSFHSFVDAMKYFTEKCGGFHIDLRKKIFAKVLVLAHCAYTEKFALECVLAKPGTSLFEKLKKRDVADEVFDVEELRKAGRVITGDDILVDGFCEELLNDMESVKKGLEFLETLED